VKLKLLACLAVSLAAVVAHAQTTAITYQGQLTVGGASANGNYDLRFTLHDSAALGNQIGGAVSLAPVAVSNGLFTATLDFGSSAFDGSPRWLQIDVRVFGDVNPHTVLSPRQAVTSAPYALQAVNAGTADILNGTFPATNLTGTLPDARLSTNVALLNSNVAFRASVSATQFNGSGAGLTNLPATNLTGTLPDARLSANVALLSNSAHFLGNVSAPFVSGNGTGLTNVPGRIFEVIPTAVNVQALANTGYLATNDTAAVVVTLPASLRVGETVRVAGSGAGGWVVAQNAGQSILIGNLLDTFGFTWQTNDSSRNWKSVASSADGAKLVAAVAGGQLYTSTDYGTTWTARSGGASWTGVASSGNGSKLAATINGGQLYTSTDSGVSWNPHGPFAAWYSIASSLDGVKLVAGVYGGQIYTSGDSGATWPAHDSNRNWIAVASSSNGSNLVAVVQGGQIYTSTNSGGNWTPRENNRNWVAVASSADGSRLLAAVNSGQLYVSVDFGVSWTATGPSSAVNWTSVASAADGSRLAAVVNLGGLYLSTDSGVSWAARGNFPSLAWTSVASSPDGSTLVVVGNPSQVYVSSQATTTPGAAGYLSGTRLSAVELEYVGNSQFMPVSLVGAVRAH
jgi:hypothetical protein